MNKFIVTTTINYPTVATNKFCKIADEKDWKFIVVGDTKTPHQEYYKLKDVSFNELELSETSCGKENYSCVDTKGDKRKIKFLKLKNMLKLKKNIDI